MRVRSAVVLGLAALLTAPAAAHETLFGISPATVYKGGWQTEFHLMQEEGSGNGKRFREREAEFSAFYGVEANASLGFRLPWKSLEEADGGPSQQASGAGDLGLIGKYRFFKRDAFISTDYASVIAEYTLAAAPRTSTPALAKGGDALLLGLGGSSIRKHWAFWADGGLRFHEKARGEAPGRETLFNLAAGWRPRVAEIDQLDFQALLELNHERQERDRDRLGEVGDSGHAAWFLSPGLRVGQGTTLFTLGVQIPIHRDWHGRQAEVDYRLKIGWEHVF